MKATGLLFWVALLACNAGALFSAESGESLKLVNTIPLPGVKGRFDHFAMDTNGHRLFVAALGNDTVEVIDVAAGKRVQTIRGLRKPTGVAFLAAENQIGAANGNDGTFRVYDGKTYEQRARVEGLDDADNVRRDGKTGLIYVGYGNGGGVSSGFVGCGVEVGKLGVADAVRVEVERGGIVGVEAFEECF